MKETATTVALACLLLFGLACAEANGGHSPVLEKPDDSADVQQPPPENFDDVLEGFVKQGAPRRATELALQFYLANLNRFDNQRYISVIDMSLHSSKDRFFLLDMTTRKAKGYVVSHGQGSDSDHNGYAERYSNVAQSKATSLGFYQVSETYYGKHGYSVRMDGLSRTNSNARPRAIVVHGASYVRKGLAKQGRSWGCPALDDDLSAGVINKIKEGSLLFVYAPQFES